jgi:hypothetical protein
VLCARVRVGCVMCTQRCVRVVYGLRARVVRVVECTVVVKGFGVRERERERERKGGKEKDPSFF